MGTSLLKGKSLLGSSTPAMFVSLLVVLLGSTALAAPVEDDHADNDDLDLDDMILSDVQKEMFSKSLIETPEQQAEADNYNEDQEPDQGGDVATGASAIGIERFKWPGKKTLLQSLSPLVLEVELEKQSKSRFKRSREENRRLRQVH